MRYHLPPVRMAIIKILQTINGGEGIKKREPSYTTDGNINWYSHYTFFKKLKLDLPHDPASALLSIYLEETNILKDTGLPMFTAALLTIVKTWEQPNVQQQRNGQSRCGTHKEWNTACMLSHVQYPCNPTDCSPPGLYPWNFPGKNTAVGWHFLLQGIFPIQGLDLCLLRLSLTHLGSPTMEYYSGH